MQKVEFKKFFTYGFQGIAALELSLTFVPSIYLLSHFFMHNYVIGISADHAWIPPAIVMMFILPAAMTFLTIWLPRYLRRKEKSNTALLFAIMAALVWIPFGYYLFVHIGAGV